MYVQKVHIENIRCIENLTMEFPANPAGWHVIIGDNGQGKSTILRGIAVTLLHNTDHIKPFWAEWLNKNKKQGEIEVLIKRTLNYKDTSSNFCDFKNGIYYSTQDNRLHTNLKLNIEGYAGNNWFSMSFGANRTFSYEDKDTSDYSTNAHLSLLDEEYRFSKITSWLKNLYKRNGKLEWIKTILNTELLPNGITFKGVEEVPKSDDLSVVFEKEGMPLSILELSDGYRSILILTLEIIRQSKYFFEDDDYIFGNIKKGVMNIPISGAILIDEIDAHLHPNWQVKIGQWFTKYFPNIQFIVTTHNPLICRAIGDNGTIWKVENGSAREITGTEKLKLRYGNILDAYGTGEFGEENIMISEEAKTLKKEMLMLNEKEMYGFINEEQQRRLTELREIF